LPVPKPGIVLDTGNLSGVVDHPARDLTVTVRAGTPAEQLAAVLAAEGQRLPVDVGPGTVCGAVAENRSGPRRLGFGTLRDYLIGVRFLTPAGAEASAGGRVVKNVAGYDLMKLHTGARGTLGVLTELTFKVTPIPEAAAVVTFGLNAAAVGPTLDRLHASAARPVAVEVLNRAAAAARGLPAPADEPWVVAVGFEEKTVTVRWQVDALAAELATAPARGLTAHTGADAGPAWAALTRPNLPDGVLLVGAVRPSRLAGLLTHPALAECVVAARGLTGAFTVVSPAASVAAATELVQTLREAAGDGHVSVRRYPADWRLAPPPLDAGRGEYALMRAVKQALDPGDVFNPGRLFGAS
jgi:glycolate oxidase FAD binding subunit